jgi:flagellar motor protein MotB
MPHVKVKNMISTSDPRVCMIGHPAPAWLVNYADLMTELVCFFIVLYALSAALSKDVQKAKKDVEEQMKQDKVATEVKVTKDGMSITLEENGENVFFESGRAELSPRMVEILSKITPTLRKLAVDGHDIVVEGHTDDIPIHNAQFTSNWELSTARATSVVQHMIQGLRMPPEHMAAIGYGEFHPLVPNNTDEHRAKNRRVVFFVKNKPANFDNGKKKPEETEAASEPAAGEAPAAEVAAAPADQLPSGEPSSNSALPLPSEAPAESANQ